MTCSTNKPHTHTNETQQPTRTQSESEMPKSESQSLMLQCSFIYPQTGKKCSNQIENKSFCSLHLLILRCDSKNVDLNLQQASLEERTNNLIQRVKRIQNSQLREQISRQLCAFVKYQQDQMHYTCQHPQILNRDLYFDKNFVLSTLQTNISQEDKLKLLSHGYNYNNFKNLPTSQLVKLVKKFKQDHVQHNQPPTSQPSTPNNQQHQPQQNVNNNNINNVNNQQPLQPSQPLEPQPKLVNGESPQSSQPISNHHHNHLNNNTNCNSTSLNAATNAPINIKQERDDVLTPEQPPTNQINNQVHSQANAGNPLVTVKEESKPIRKPLAPTTPNNNKLNNVNNSNIVVNRKCLAPKFTSDQVKQINTTAGILRTNLRHFEHSYDSDATESSSGGESCDELDDYLNDLCKQQKLDSNSITPLPLNQKSNWKWALERGSIVSRYTWLQAQIADLDFKIRQQNEIYKQFRSSKGQISFYSNESNQPAANGEPQSCIRTLPLKEMKKRKLVRSVFALTNANRKDRHSSVLCSCNSLPSFSNSCVLCNERYSYIQMIDTDCMPISERVALLDASYHSVLSLPENVSLGLHFSKLLKKETVQRPAVRNANYKKKKICPKGELGLKFKNDLKTKKKSQALIQSTKLKKKYEGNNKKHQLLNKKANKVRLNNNKVNNKERYESSNYSDESSRHDSPLPSQFVNNNDGSLISNSLRRRRSEQNAYDPFNIVIPYSIASTTRVERLQYKEIITPKWRVTDDLIEVLDEMEVDKELDEVLNNSNNNKPTSRKTSTSSLNKLLLSESPPEKMDTSEPVSASTSLNNNSATVVDNLLDGTNDIDVSFNSKTTIENNDEDSNLTQSTEEGRSDSLEDLSDETFIERHLKCEADEKKRFSSYLKNPLNGGSRGRGAVRQRTESTKSESINLESSAIDGSSQDSFSNVQINLNLSTTSDKAGLTAKSPDGIPPTAVSVFEDNSNQSTSKTRTYSLSSKRDDQLDEENHIEVIPFEKRNFPLNDNEFQNLLS